MDVCDLIKAQIPKFVVKVEEFETDPDKRNYVVSNAKLEKLGWSCDFSVEDGIAELRKAYEMILHRGKRNYTNL